MPKNDIKIITFNYDRSFEHFLYLAYYALGGRTHSDPNLVSARLRNLGFIHAHGILSPLPWWDAANGRPYGATKDVAVILECSRRVLLADANVQISYAGIPARELIEAADAVFFLGFGFDPVNMRKLGLTGVKAVPPKYFGASGLGLAARRKTELTQQFGNFCFFENIEEAFDTYDFTFRPRTPEANH